MMFLFRQLVRSKSVFSAAIALVALVCSSGGARAEVNPRLTMCFNPGWRFLKEDVPAGERVDLDDSGWQTVSAPHTYNDTDTFDDWSLGGLRGEINQWGGRTWYRKHFDAPKDWQGKAVVIEFEAVRQLAEIYVNGQRVGMNQSGFVPFGFDLAPFLEFGKPNVIAVMCDNSFAVSGKGGNSPVTWPNVGNAKLPWNNPQWHPAHGGIYRNVWLHVLNPVHLTLPLLSNLGTTGCYVYATDVSATSARLGFEAQAANATKAPAPVELTATLLDRDGKIVSEVRKSAVLGAGETQALELGATLANPHRWEPGYPYLYSVRFSLSAGGKLVDQASEPLGVRAVKFDMNNSFAINDHSLKLHGWGQKPTDEWAGLGAAMPDWMHDFTIRLMKEAGGNFIRWGHSAAGPSQISADDRYGMITLQPGVDGELDIADEPTWKIRAEAFRDVVVYFRNHPSILIWEGGNQKVVRAHAAELKGYVTRYDPHGGRAYAHRRADHVTGEFMDVTIGTEGSHEERNLPVVEGEYDREEAPRRVADRFTPPWETFHSGPSYDLTDEQFAVNEVGNYVTKVCTPGHCGGANWIFSDSTSGGRNTTEVTRASGEVDAVRLPKQAYYVCAAMWKDAPTVHIIGHWNYPAGTVKPVYVVSNAAQIELFINGRSLGLGTRSDRYLFTFDKVAWESGEVRAVARDEGGLAVAEDQIPTVGPAAALRMTPITAPGGLAANGSDVALFDVEAVDAQGRRCVTWQQRADFELKGPGLWRGGYDSGKLNSTNKPYLDLEAGINRVAVCSTLSPGDISLTVRSGELPAVTVHVPSHVVTIANGMYASAPVVPAQAPL